MSPYRLHAAQGTSLPAVFIQPVARLLELNTPGALCVGVCASAWAFVTQSAFSTVLAILFLASCWDYVTGSVRARKSVEGYIAAKAHAGALSKITALIQLLLLRALETVVPGDATHGALALGCALGLTAVELASIEKNRTASGATPIPLFSPALAWVTQAATKMIPLPSSAAFPMTLPGGEVVPAERRSEPRREADKVAATVVAAVAEKAPELLPTPPAEVAG